jgi:hypothetical protein
VWTNSFIFLLLGKREDQASSSQYMRRCGNRPGLTIAVHNIAGVKVHEATFAFFNF